MMVWKWFCFILVVLDSIGWLLDKADDSKCAMVSSGERVGSFIGIVLGVIARGYFLFNVAQYWLA